MSYYCPVCKTSGHVDVEHARNHYAESNASKARTSGTVNRVSQPGYQPAPWRMDPPTDRQLDRISRDAGRLGIAVPVVATKGEASDTIRVLGTVKPSGTITALAATPSAQPLVEPPTGPARYEARSWQAAPFNPLPLSTVALIPAGRYAVTVPDGSATAFIRIVRPRTGRMAGTTTIQSKHGEAWTARLRYWGARPPVRVASQTLFGTQLEELLTLILVAPAESALAYAERWHTCCRCGTELTDDRSRYYGIGPECEKHRPDVIGLVNERKGEYTLGAASPW